MKARPTSSRSTRAARRQVAPVSTAATGHPASISRRALLGLALIGALFLLRYEWVADVGFLDDDFLFLDHARASSFWHLWTFDDAVGNFYRPLTRNLYFWLGLHLFGHHPGPYHVVNLTIALGGLLLLFLVLRQMLSGGGARNGAATRPGTAEAPALLGTLLFALHPAAGTPLAWVCGIQDVLVVVLVLAATLAHLHGRRVAYTVLLAAAILSKETAALLPPVLWLYDVLVAHTGAGRATRRQLAPMVVIAVWAAGNRMLPWSDLGRAVSASSPGERVAAGHVEPSTVWHAVRALFLIEPIVSFDWPSGWWTTGACAALVVAVIAIARRLDWPRRPSRAILAVGGVWAATGLLPLLLLKSHFVYYAYYPALGVCLAAAALLARLVGGSAGAHRRVGARSLVPLVAAGILSAALFVGAGFTYLPGQCDAHRTRRASGYLQRFRADLLRLHPTLPDSARCFFRNIPSNIGFQMGDGPALRVWYENPSLTGYFFSQYTTDPSRQSLFFAFDSREHLVELVPGADDPNMRHPPAIYGYALDDLGAMLGNAGEDDAALVEWRKAITLDPNDWVALSNSGVTLARHQRIAEAAPLLERAVRLNPEHWRSQFALAVVETNLGLSEEAARRFDLIEARAPASDEANRVRALRATLPPGSGASR